MYVHFLKYGKSATGLVYTHMPMGALAVGHEELVYLPALNTLVMAGTPKSKIATMQLVGRVLRKTDDKSTVDVYDIQDFNCKYFTSASKERREIYLSEPEFVLQEDNMFT